jgi:hypothetical protein
MYCVKTVSKCKVKATIQTEAVSYLIHQLSSLKKRRTFYKDEQNRGQFRNVGVSKQPVDREV